MGLAIIFSCFFIASLPSMVNILTLNNVKQFLNYFWTSILVVNSELLNFNVWPRSNLKHENLTDVYFFGKLPRVFLCIEEYCKYKVNFYFFCICQSRPSGSTGLQVFKVNFLVQCIHILLLSTSNYQLETQDKMIMKYS